MTQPATLFEKHKDVLNAALIACDTRAHWSPFKESPSTKIHGVDAPMIGKARFEAQLNQPFELDQPGEIGRTGSEVSPYTQAALGIDYPKSDVDVLFKVSKAAMDKWRDTDIKTRAGLCIEMLFELEKQAFENAHATMHTAGQSYLMAFSGSGANALDRGMEALAYAYKAQDGLPQSAIWEKDFGKTGKVRLRKTYELRPRGTAIVICCATFPLWNAYPAVFANLMTGNPVILKPHPNGILPVAMAARVCRSVLAREGFDPNLVLMAADTRDAPVTIDLLEHRSAKIVDYTGSQAFGHWIEQNCRDKLVYTETAGCNAVVIESSDDIEGTIAGLANCLCAFSAQMCTTPQNIHIPETGIATDQGHWSFEQFRDRLCDAISERVQNDGAAARLCGALQAEQSLNILRKLRASACDTVAIARDWDHYIHPDFPQARTATPLVLEVTPEAEHLFQEEHFAPVSFLIREKDAEGALEHATQNAERFGAISSYLYSADPSFSQKSRRAFADAGASLWCNMGGRMPINFAAAYSDFHVTGLNPAGNACLTDLAFVADRFRVVQFREPIPMDGSAA